MSNHPPYKHIPGPALHSTPLKYLFPFLWSLLSSNCIFCDKRIVHVSNNTGLETSIASCEKHTRGDSTSEICLRNCLKSDGKDSNLINIDNEILDVWWIRCRFYIRKRWFESSRLFFQSLIVILQHYALAALHFLSSHMSNIRSWQQRTDNAVFWQRWLDVSLLQIIKIGTDINTSSETN